MADRPKCDEEGSPLGTVGPELVAIMLTHGQPIQVQVRAWVAAIPPAERVEKLITAYITCRIREEGLEAQLGRP